MNKTYDPKSFEDRIYARWQEKKYFHARPNPDKKPFTVVIPPPNITGQLHIGHALNDTIQDAIIRYKRMKGFETLWLPGTDHASIATEVKIVEKMREEGLTKESVGREGFLKRAYEWKEQYGGRIVEQFKKLGLSCDWDRLAFTMDERCSKAVREVFVRLYDKGLIYRGDRIINWCPECGTAISDAEVEYETEEGHLWHIKYPVAGTDEYIVVATTRPETMLGDTAVAVHPSDKRYSHLVGKTVTLPLVGRSIPIVADRYVDKSFGTGAVKITPAHDPNDFEVGLRHGLEVIRVMNDDATMNERAGKYAGLSREQARKDIIADLDALGLLLKVEAHEHNVGHCYRCHTTIEPIVSKQWFVRMKALADPAIKAVQKREVSFLPRRFEKIYLHWMNNIRDWCISRQLWWGHRIPVFYCDDCGEMIASKEDIAVCPKCGKPMRQDEDVLDTWFSSALWPFSTLGWPDDSEDLRYFYPTDLLVTAYDIITFWVSRMIFSGIEHMGEKPFDTVLIHGIVRDAEGRKMSKSLGNGVDPLVLIERYGADPLRYSLINGISPGSDIRFSEEKLEAYRNFMNKIWNAARFVLMNAEGVKIRDLDDVKLTAADKWILSQLNSTTAAVTRFMDKYEVGLAATRLYEFIWNKFCDWYIEFSKTSLYSADDDRRTGTVSVLVYVLRETVKLVHPFIPFVTAEIYDQLPNRDAEDIMIAPYPEFSRRRMYVGAVAATEAVMELIKGVRNLRRQFNVAQSRRTAIYIKPAPGKEGEVRRTADNIVKLAGGESITIGEPAEKSASLLTPLGKVYIPMGELIDFDKERERLNAEIAKADEEIARAEGKLANPGFVQKAPAALVNKEREKLAKFTERKAALLQALDHLREE